MLDNLFQVLQLTRGQVQYGYLVSGVPRERLSDLAQHHYLVTFIAWRLARVCVLAGAKLNVLKILEISLVHDLGEVFGGDINWFYAKQNPAARKMAKAFESENNKFLSALFQSDGQYFEQLIHSDSSDEYKIAKIADYMECLQFKHYANSLNWTLDTVALSAIHQLACELTDLVVQKSVSDFILEWQKQFES